MAPKNFTRMVGVLALLWGGAFAAMSDVDPESFYNTSSVDDIVSNLRDPTDEAVLSTGIFFCPVNPKLFTVWRRESLAPRGLLHQTDPRRYDTFDIHTKVAPIVFAGETLQKIIDTFRSGNDTSKVSPTARAVIRAIYTIRIYRDIFGPLPKYRRHDIYDVITNFDFSNHRHDTSRVLTFMFMIPRVQYVWDSWKYLARRYRLPSVVELARIVGSIAAYTHMFWFDEMFSL